MTVDTRPVPPSLLRWPRTRDLITQQKFIFMYLWPHPDQTAAGCYLLPLDATAADLSMTSASIADAMAELVRRGLVESDAETGEIALPDWFRFYHPRSPAARGAVESAINKINSKKLKQLVTTLYLRNDINNPNNSIKSIQIPRKGKGKVKEKDSLHASTDASNGESLAQPAHAMHAEKNGDSVIRPESNRGLQNLDFVAGVALLHSVEVHQKEPRDLITITELVEEFGAVAVEQAAKKIVAAGGRPFPSLVRKSLKETKNENCGSNVRPERAHKQSCNGREPDNLNPLTALSARSSARRASRGRDLLVAEPLATTAGQA